MLTDTHPALAAQLVDSPGRLTETSQKKMRWRCAAGHTWDERVSLRVQRGGDCLICDGTQLAPGVNDLATTYPGLAAEAAGWDPTGEPWGATRKRRWRCPTCTHRYVTTTAKRVAGAACPTCSKGGDPASKILADRRPDLAAEAAGWDPSTVIVSDRQPRQWRCASGHTWTANVGHRISHGTGCPTCAGKNVQSGFNDLATTHPHLALEAVGWDPTTVTAGAAAELTWKCTEGHTWAQSPSQRTWIGSPSGCPVCAGKTVLPGFNDLATTHPHLALEADGWDPTTVISATGQHLPWKCAEGHTWEATIANRKTTRGCPYCNGVYAIPGVTDLATTHPEIAAELANADPTRLLPGSDHIGVWRCGSGHEWQEKVGNRTRGSCCPECLANELGL